MGREVPTEGPWSSRDFKILLVHVSKVRLKKTKKKHLQPVIKIVVYSMSNWLLFWDVMKVGSDCYFCNRRRTWNSKEKKLKSSSKKFQYLEAFFLIPKPWRLQLPSAPTVGHVGEFICGVHQLLRLVSCVIWRVALSHTRKRISLRATWISNLITAARVAVRGDKARGFLYSSLSLVSGRQLSASRIEGAAT